MLDWNPEQFKSRKRVCSAEDFRPAGVTSHRSRTLRLGHLEGVENFIAGGARSDAPGVLHLCGSGSQRFGDRRRRI
jgi:hypothetical protein